MTTTPHTPVADQRLAPLQAAAGLVRRWEGGIAPHDLPKWSDEAARTLQTLLTRQPCQRLTTEALSQLVMLGVMQMMQTFKLEKQDADKLREWARKTTERASPPELNDTQRYMVAVFDALAMVDCILEGSANA